MLNFVPTDPINHEYSSICSDYGLVSARRQAIIWTKDGLVYWHMYESLSFDELTDCGLVTPYGGRDLGQHWLR